MKASIAWMCALIAFPIGSPASQLVIPYAGGKASGSVVVEMASNMRMSPDTLKIGAITVRFAALTDVLPAVCGAKPMMAVQFLAPHGLVSQTADTSTEWTAFATMPSSGLIAVDSLNLLKGGVAAPAWRAPGFALFEAGPKNTCMHDEYFMATGWNRVVFLRYGSGVDYRAKLSFRTVIDSSYALTPMIQGTVLKSLTLHYVLNANSGDLHEPLISLAPRMLHPRKSPQGWRDMNLYDVRGVRVHREPLRFQAVVPVARRVTR